jgi:hypothetical protein
MKKILLSFLVLSIVFLGCGKFKKNSDEKDSLNNDTLVQDGNNEVIAFDKNKLEKLPELIKKTPKNTQNKFDAYINMLSSDIKSEDDIKKIFDARETLLPLLDEFFQDYAYNEEMDWDEWSLIDEELMMIGFATIYAEGMYVGLDVSEILTDEIEKYGSEAFKLYSKFNVAYSNSLGGEYPYLGLSSYCDVVAAGEGLYKKYKNSEYYKKIEDNYKDRLMSSLDIHIVNNGDETDCYASGFSTEYWPFAADCEAIEYFIETYPKSMYTKVYEAVSKNMSEMNVEMGEGDMLGTVYVIVTDVADDWEDANNVIFSYLNSGVDIVHSLSIEIQGTATNIVAYRFYSEESRAKEEIKKIQKVVKSAYILKVNIFNDGTAIALD